ncbi:MAG: hypothetical protein ACRDV3_10715, partial [Acidothermaceae bacterium]
VPLRWRDKQGWDRTMGGSMQDRVKPTVRATPGVGDGSLVSSNGVSRRQVLRAGAAVGAGLVWVAPVVSGLGMTSAHAATASGGGGGGTSSPPNSPPSTSPTATPSPPSSPPTGSTSPTPTATPTETHTPAPNTTPEGVLGVNFQQPPPPQVNPPVGVAPIAVTKPTATLPFTGAAVPVTSALALGAGLVATGAAAVVATRRRVGLATAGPTGAHTRPAQPTQSTELAQSTEPTERIEPSIDGGDLPAS